jgi:hypothetical protein
MGEETAVAVDISPHFRRTAAGPPGADGERREIPENGIDSRRFGRLISADQ